MDVDSTVAEYEDLLEGVATDLYGARREFLQSEFDGYVADTHYFVPDSGYFCWPAHTEGEFIGFTDLLERERRALNPLLDHGFTIVGVGASRVVCRVPDADLAVKLGRCGMGEKFGMGRVHNLIEFGISTNSALPVLPSLYCSPQGEFAIYPYADPIEDVSDTDIGDLHREIRSAIPKLKREEYTDQANLCRWQGDLYTLDYSTFTDVSYPVGIPEHVDPQLVIDGVDKLRRRGEKRDILERGTLISPQLSTDDTDDPSSSEST